MKLNLFKWLNIKYPQNFIVKKPFIGTLIYMAFCIGFVIIYKPFNFHPSRLLSFNLTMMIYFGLPFVPVFLVVKVLKRFRFFSVGDDWTFLKELISLLIILSGLGITIYFLGFVMEPPAQRWNMATFLDSCKYGFLVGIFPYAFFTLINYQYLFVKEVFRLLCRQLPKEGRIEFLSKSADICRVRWELCGFLPEYWSTGEEKYHPQFHQQYWGSIINHSTLYENTPGIYCERKAGHFGKREYTGLPSQTQWNWCRNSRIATEYTEIRPAFKAIPVINSSQKMAICNNFFITI